MMSEVEKTFISDRLNERYNEGMQAMKLIYTQAIEDCIKDDLKKLQIETKVASILTVLLKDNDE